MNLLLTWLWLFVSTPAILMQTTSGAVVSGGVEAGVSSGFPNASNTGVPAGVNLTPSSGFTVTTNGTTIDALDVTGNITISANDVTVKRTRVSASVGSSYAIKITDGKTGAHIQDVELDGNQGTDKCFYSGIGSSGTLVERVNIHDCQDGVQGYSNETYADNYIHNLGCDTQNSICGGADPHSDGLQFNGGNANVLIQHNTVDLDELTQTAVVNLTTDFGSMSAMIVNDNLLIGAGYTCYRDADPGGGSRSISVTYSNNKLVPCQTGEPYGQHCTSSTGWDLGSCLSRGLGTLTWTNNTSYTSNTDYNIGDQVLCPSP